MPPNIPEVHTLSSFDWALIVGAALVVSMVIGYLIKLSVSRFIKSFDNLVETVAKIPGEIAGVRDELRDEVISLKEMLIGDYIKRSEFTETVHELRSLIVLRDRYEACETPDECPIKNVIAKSKKIGGP